MPIIEAPSRHSRGAPVTSRLHQSGEALRPAALFGLRLIARNAKATLLFTLGMTLGGTAMAAGVNTDWMAPGVAPGNNFYQYANGTWLAHTAIPPDRSSWGPFAQLDEQVTTLTRQLLEQTDPAHATPDTVRAIHLYRAFLDQTAIEAKGLTPLAPALAAIEGIQTDAELATALGDGIRADVDPLNNTSFATANLLGLWVAPGLHDTGTYLPYLLQGGLSLPDREFYVGDSPKMQAIRAAFQKHIAAMFTLAQLPDAQTRAAAVFDLEQRIAQGHAKREDSEDVLKADHVWTRAEFAEKAPGLDWERLLTAAGLGDATRIAVWHPDALAAEARLVKEVPVAVWRDWLRLHLLDGHAQVLPKAFDLEAFAFYGTTLYGVPQQRERWKRALNATNAALPDAVGQLYVAKAFPESSKQRVQTMVRGIVAAFDQRVAHLKWMAPETRAEARAKLRTLYVGVGYPDQWTRYDGLEVDPQDAVGNLDRAMRFHRAQEVAHLGQAVDRTRWCMPPQLVNAVNLPVQNALNFPAAILQPPYFDPAASDAANYGAIGAIIGHEISHSFDDQGAQFDAHGALRNWWTAKDLAHFQASSAALAQQFSAYHPFPDVAVNGQQTLSENIADVAGLTAAYAAFHALPATRAAMSAKHARHLPQDLTGAHGFTLDQQFFLAFAQSWQEVERDEALRQQLVVDGHAPAQYRALTVRNLDPWYSAFGVKAGAELYLSPQARVQVW